MDKIRICYYILRNPSEALKKVYAAKNPVKSTGIVNPEDSFKRAIKCFNSKFGDIYYSVRCMCMYISRHYICENWALKQGRSSPFAYSYIWSQFQAFGSGKSRTSQLVSLVMDTLYISSETQSGFPKECQIFEDFKKSLDDWIMRKPGSIPIAVILVVRFLTSFIVFYFYV
jgi:hypothetical protein